MVQSFLRFLALFPFIAGTATLVGDTARSVYEGRPLLLSLNEFLAAFLPNWLIDMEEWFTATLSPASWTSFDKTLLNLPGTPLFLGLAVLLFFMGRVRPPRKTLRRNLGRNSGWWHWPMKRRSAK